jgi:hypothetical protein
VNKQTRVMTQAKLNELSQAMYRVLYPNDKPKYNLDSNDFMELLFVLDELSTTPILRSK